MREQLRMNAAWTFHPGEIDTVPFVSKSLTYMSSKTQRAQVGPAAKTYRAIPDDWNPQAVHVSDCWFPVTLPHDYMIGETPSAANGGTFRFSPVTP